MNYPHIAARLFSRPQMLHEGKLQAILSWLSPRMGVEAPRIAAEVEHQSAGGESETEGAVAVINVGGTLVCRGAGSNGFSGITSYEWLSCQVRESADDQNIKAVILRFDSYGGEVSGAFDCADVIASAAKEKPVWAVVDDNCYSAAYLLASQCKRIYTTRTGGCGSIGVIAVHCDQSGYDSKVGLKFTAVYAGARKNDFSSHQPLAEEPLTWLRSEVDRDYQMFAEYVARGRGISADAAKATEAALYTGSDAVAAKLADEVGTFQDALTALVGAITTPMMTGGRMAQPLAAADVPVTAQTPRMDGGEDCPNEDCPMREASCKKKGNNMTERERIAAILNLPEANGRTALAHAIAFRTELSVDDAKVLLAAGGKDAPAVNPLAAEMARVSNPDVGVGAATAAINDESAAIAMILGTQGVK